MIETTTSRKILDQQEILNLLLLKPSFPFACWKLPQNEELHVIVSLSEPRKIDGPLSGAASGFVVNKFEDSHPVHPILIQGDILIKSDGSIETSNRISEYELNQFIDDLFQSAEQAPKEDAPIPQNQPQEVSTEFESMVKKALQMIQSSEVDKVVLSRYEDVKLDNSVKSLELFLSLVNSYQNAFCNVWSVGDGAIWMGASPETLVAQYGSTFRTISLAGTQPLAG